MITGTVGVEFNTPPDTI